VLFRYVFDRHRLSKGSPSFESKADRGHFTPSFRGSGP
jgi:hypothetical protein